VSVCGAAARCVKCGKGSLPVSFRRCAYRAGGAVSGLPVPRNWPPLRSCAFRAGAAPEQVCYTLPRLPPPRRTPPLPPAAPPRFRNAHRFGPGRQRVLALVRDLRARFPDQPQTAGDLSAAEDLMRRVAAAG
jgi:hypothetical protein